MPPRALVVSLGAGGVAGRPPRPSARLSETVASLASPVAAKEQQRKDQQASSRKDRPLKRKRGLLE